MSIGLGGIGIDGAVGGVAGAVTAINISAGTTSNNLSAVTFANSNGVSFGLNASTVTASHAINVSAGTTSNNLSAITFANSNQISFGINASTITASGGTLSVDTGLTVTTGTGGTTLKPIEMSVWRNFHGNFVTLATAQSNSVVSIQPFLLQWPVVFSNVYLPVGIICASTNNTSSVYIDLSVSAVFYSRNVSTLSYITSFSNTMTSTFSSNGAPTQYFAITMTNAAATTLIPGEYFLAVHLSTDNTATNASTATTAIAGNTVSMVAAYSMANLGHIRSWGGAVVQNSFHLGGAGVVSTGATRSSLAFTDYTASGTRPLQGVVAFELRNVTWNV